MPLNTHGTRAIMERKTLTLRSDTRGISSQTAFPESCRRVPGRRRGWWGPVGPRCCTLTTEKTSGGEPSAAGGLRGEARSWRWRLLAFCVRRCAAAPLQLRQDLFPRAPNPVAVFQCILWKKPNRTLHFPVILTWPAQLLSSTYFPVTTLKAQMFASARLLPAAP